MWFTEDQPAPGSVAFITPSANTNEFVAGSSTGLTPKAFPERIAVGPDGALWFAESNAGAIARLTTEGRVSELIGGVQPGFSTNTAPDALAVGPDGNLWVAEFSGPTRVRSRASPRRRRL